MKKIKAKQDLVTYNETIFDIADLALVRLEMLLSLSYEGDIPEGGDIPAVCPLAEALIRDARNLLAEGNDYIEKEFGKASIVRACHGQIGVTGTKMLCVDFEPSVISPLGKSAVK